jgi:hypothetical protein
MKLIDFVYAHIYSWYNRMRLNGRKVDPQRYTTIAFLLWFIGLFFVGIILYDLPSRKMIPANEGYIGGIGALIAAGLLNEFYSRNDRYLRVYNKYTSNGQVQIKGIAYLYAWLFILAPYVLITVLLFMKAYFIRK